jgi:hypothetical protein
MPNIFKFSYQPYIVLFFIFFIANTYSYENDANSSSCEERQQFTFSWQFNTHCDMVPRGGTTQGTKITLDPSAHQGWLDLKEKGLSNFEKDRRAILAMSGPYRTSFDFIEIVGYTPGFRPDKPYQSWGTEYVYVVEDQDDFISLQHIMVMYVQTNDKISEPIVMKHWRQDWQYEKQEILSYIGNNTWKKKSLSKKEINGSWSQAVYQVEDSPRYESFGRWEHNSDFSTWLSAKTWRPLPRREYSVRDDYQILDGFNRHTIVPSGWIHEQENYKLVLNFDDKFKQKNSYLSKELGLNRYERIVEHDFTPGHRYWEKTSFYWRDVRIIWSELIHKKSVLVLEKLVDGQPLFINLFDYAEKLQIQPYDSEKGKIFIRKTLTDYIKSHTF